MCNLCVGKLILIFLIVTSRSISAGSVALRGIIVQFGRLRGAEMTRPKSEIPFTDVAASMPRSSSYASAGTSPTG
jgi:hypothetical protein